MSQNAGAVLRHNGGEIRYFVTGSGPPVVLIHGFTLDHRMWQSQIDLLEDGHTVVAYDCRGFGRSSSPSGPYSHADDLRALLDHLDIETCVIVGASMGGRIALTYALGWPKRVRSLFLVGTDAGGYRFDLGWDVPVAYGLDAARQAWRSHPIFEKVRLMPAAWSQVCALIDDYSAWHWLYDDVRCPPDTDTLRRLDEIAAPTTVVVGSDDLPDFHRITAMLVSRMPNVRRVEVVGAGHLVSLEASAALNKLLARHLMDCW